MTISELADFDDRHLALVFSAMLLVVPGVLILGVFFPDYLVKLDVLKLLLISISITVPISIVYLLAIGASEESKAESSNRLTSGQNGIMATLGAGMFIFNIQTYILLVFAYFLSWTFREFVVGQLVFTVFVIVIAAVRVTQHVSKQTKEGKSPGVEK